MRIAGIVLVLGVAACAAATPPEGTPDEAAVTAVSTAASAGADCPMMQQRAGAGRAMAGGCGGAGNCATMQQRAAGEACPMHANHGEAGAQCPNCAAAAAAGECSCPNCRMQASAAETSVPEASHSSHGSSGDVALDPIARGREIFTGRGNCSTCHGADARGTALAPNLTDDTALHLDGSVRAVHRVIMHGVSQPRVHPQPMPAKGGADLTHADVMDVAAYVMTLDD